MHRFSFDFFQSDLLVLHSQIVWVESTLFEVVLLRQKFVDQAEMSCLVLLVFHQHSSLWVFEEVFIKVQKHQLRLLNQADQASSEPVSLQVESVNIRRVSRHIVIGQDAPHLLVQLFNLFRFVRQQSDVIIDGRQGALVNVSEQVVYMTQKQKCIVENST